ncbi:uncharacterized protein LOC142075963 [Calonectris borealis]|uniref:uncharacterized protein LOC142075963 n=1 Tax=Calonectris borealis TaxID=1323832 RepID=UPI003F4BDEAC
MECGGGAPAASSPSPLLGKPAGGENRASQPGNTVAAEADPSARGKTGAGTPPAPGLLEGEAERRPPFAGAPRELRAAAGKPRRAAWKWHFWRLAVENNTYSSGLGLTTKQHLLARSAEAVIGAPGGFVPVGWFTQLDYIFHGAMQAFGWEVRRREVVSSENAAKECQVCQDLRSTNNIKSGQKLLNSLKESQRKAGGKTQRSASLIRLPLNSNSCFPLHL